MQIPASAGTFANSVLPVTPTQGGLLSPVGETAGSASFAPVEAVSNISLSRAVPQQGGQPAATPENITQPEASSTRSNEQSAGEARANEDTAEQASASDGSDSIQDQANGNSEGADGESKQQARNEANQKKQDLAIVRALSQRDSEVHAHENAHSAVGGQYAGSASYTYQRGPDGVNYAVGGEVSIDVSAIPGNPQATLEKMQLVQRAALAPAEPSAQDRKVAALAAQQANEARAELASESRGTSSPKVLTEAEKAEKAEATKPTVNSSQRSEADSKPAVSSQNFQAANDRIAKINEILVAISQNDTSKASGQLLDAVV